MADSVGMLRTLSMSGNLGMPGLTGSNNPLVSGPLEDFHQRRESGRVYDEAETEDLDSLEGWWAANGVNPTVGVAQVV